MGVVEMQDKIILEKIVDPPAIRSATVSIAKEVVPFSENFSVEELEAIFSNTKTFCDKVSQRIETLAGERPTVEIVPVNQSKTSVFFGQVKAFPGYKGLALKIGGNVTSWRWKIS